MRAIRLAAHELNVHTQLVGATGRGKSTWLANAVLDLVGHAAVILIDPKDGETVREVLLRVPHEHWPLVRVVMPWGQGLRWPVGLNLLEPCGSRDDEPEVIVDRAVAIFKSLYRSSGWGPKVEDVLRMACLTLLRHRGTRLTDLVPLLLDREARRRWTQDLDDPIGLEPFWREYERQAAAERLPSEVTSILYKLRSVLLMRPGVRNMLGQPDSLDLEAILDQRGILLVSLPAGKIGDETTRLLAAVLVARIWQVLRATRTGRAAAERPPAVLMADEFPDLIHLPEAWEHILAEARSFNLGLILGHQHQGQLPTQVRQAVAANALHKVAWQPAHEDEAKDLAKVMGLSAEQLMSLQSRQVAVRLGLNGASGPPFLGMTRPLPPSLGEEHGAELLAFALERWGRPRAEVDAEMRRRYGGSALGGPEEEFA